MCHILVLDFCWSFFQTNGEIVQEGRVHGSDRCRKFDTDFTLGVI